MISTNILHIFKDTKEIHIFYPHFVDLKYPKGKSYLELLMKHKA